MCGRRHGNVALLTPRTGTGHIFHAGIFIGIFIDATTIEIFELHDVVELLAGDAFGIVDVAVRVGHRDGHSAQSDEFLGGVLGHVART